MCKNGLCSWALEHNITHLALSALLVLINKLMVNMNISDKEFSTSGNPLNLPLTARTLFCTQKHGTSIFDIDGRKYIHFGVEKVLNEIITDYLALNLTVIRKINLLINIDRLPISKSSNSALWPILLFRYSS